MSIHILPYSIAIFVVLCCTLGTTNAATIGQRSTEVDAGRSDDYMIYPVPSLRQAQESSEDSDEDDEEDDAEQAQQQNYVQQQQEESNEDSEEDEENDDDEVDESDDSNRRRRRRDTVTVKQPEAVEVMPAVVTAVDTQTNEDSKKDDESAVGEPISPTAAAAAAGAIPVRNTSVLILIRDALKKVTSELPTQQVATNALQYFQLFEHFLQQTIENVIGDDDDDDDEATTIKTDVESPPEDVIKAPEAQEHATEHTGVTDSKPMIVSEHETNKPEAVVVAPPMAVEHQKPAELSTLEVASNAV